MPETQNTQGILADSPLQSANIMYAVPTWSSHWEGSDILFIEVKIATSDGKQFTGTAEHRNTPIGNGYAVYPPIGFRSDELKFIVRSKIVSLDVSLTADPGDKGGGGFPSPHESHYRVEVRLEFSDGSKLFTGYNDPAGTIRAYSDGRPHHVVFNKPANGFYTEPTLIEPVH